MAKRKDKKGISPAHRVGNRRSRSKSAKKNNLQSKINDENQPIDFIAKIQPHRRGSTNPRLCSAIGRIIEGAHDLTRGVSRQALHDTATRYSEIYRQYQAVVASNDGLSTSGMGTGAQLDDAAALKIKRAYNGMLHEIRCMGRDTRYALAFVCLEHHDETWQPSDSGLTEHYCIEGLIRLANYFGIEWRGEDKRKEATRAA